jgi:hypothetical protein
MPQYNWERVIRRLALASAFSVLIALQAHTSKNAWPPRICNGGFMDGVQFVVQLLIAMLVVEGFHWITWQLRHTSKAFRAKQQSEIRISFATGGRLFAPVGAFSTFLLALFVLQISVVYIGSATPCAAVDPSNISRKMIVASIVEGYGLLLLAEAALRKLPRRSIS